MGETPILAGLVVSLLVTIVTLKNVENGFILIGVMYPFGRYAAVGDMRPVYIVSVLVIGIVISRYIFQNKGRFPRYIIVYISTIASALVYGWLAGQGANLIHLLKQIGSALLVVSAFLYFDSQAKIERWIWAYAMSTSVVSCIILTLMAIFPHNTDIFMGVSSEGVRLQGLMSNPNKFASGQTLAVFALLYMAYKSELLKRGFYCVLSIILIVTIFLSQSRGAVTGLFVGGIVTIVIIIWRAEISRIQILGFVSVLLFVAAIFLNLPKSVGGNRLARLSEASSTTIYDINMDKIEEQRLDLFAHSMGLALKNPFGIGFVTSREIREKMSFGRKKINKLPHSHISNYFIRYGLVYGAIMNLLWLWVPTSVLYKSFRENKTVEYIAIFMMAGSIAYIINSLAHSYIDWVQWWLYWALTYKSGKI